MLTGAAALVFLFSSVLVGTSFAQTTGGLPALTLPQVPSKVHPRKNIERQPVSPSKSALSVKDADSRTLLDSGWQAFVGVAGVVDERTALKYTLAAIEKLNTKTDDASKRMLSLAQNNLSVIYLCAINLNIRDVVAGLSQQSDLKSSLAQDNYVWAVFLRRESVQSSTDFHKLLLEYFPGHPVTRYMTTLGGQLPADVESAYDFLVRMAEAGDPNAAMRVGFSQECGFSSVDINNAILWYDRAKELQIAIGASPQALKRIDDRIRRLSLIRDGKSTN